MKIRESLIYIALAVSTPTLAMGLEHSMLLKQSGDHNEYLLHQSGRMHTAIAEQTGNYNHIEHIQFGSSHYSSMLQSGDSNTIKLEQRGVGRFSIRKRKPDREAPGWKRIGKPHRTTWRWAGNKNHTNPVIGEEHEKSTLAYRTEFYHLHHVGPPVR